MDLLRAPSSAYDRPAPDRLLTGSTYVLLGVDAARAPGARVDQAAATLAALRKVVPVQVDDELIVRGNGAVQVVGGALLASGTLPRLAALALAGSMIPTTVAGHAFWKVDDPAARKLQRIQFHKNMAMIGGLLFAQQVAAARLALGAWLGELAVSGSSERPLPRELVHELLLLRIELVAARSGGSATRTEAFPSSTIGDSRPDPLTAIDGVLDRLDQMIGSAGLRAVRPRP